MNRLTSPPFNGNECVPHGRGDEPLVTDAQIAFAIVFPTGVGMNRTGTFSPLARPCVPHGRGDEPAQYAIVQAKKECSPRAWG